MGCGPSVVIEIDIEAQKKSDLFDMEAKKQHDDDLEVKKLLFLGAGESGKSTLFKQAITLYGKGYSNMERMQYVSTIVKNTLNSAQTLIRYTRMLHPPHPIAYECEQAAALIMAQDIEDDHPGLSTQLAAAITQIWADPGIQATFERRAEFQLDDSTPYFLGKPHDVAKQGYIPSDQDVLRARVRTTGIVETSFLIDGVIFKMFDVGGQRNERKKWIHCFENVTAVLFVAAISEYDQKLFEDESCNRMSEALTLFDEIVNSRWFIITSIILFLNKKDLFEDKLKKLPLTVCPEFEDYDGSQDYDECCEYVTGQFEEKLKKEFAPNKQIFTHITTATDTENIRVVFNAVKQIIISAALQDGGLL